MSTNKTPAESQENQEIREETAAAPEKTEAGKKDKKSAKHADELKKLQDTLKAEQDKYLRMLAEYDNFRKRSQKERECTYTDVRADTVAKFLPVYDNLERAIKQETTDEAYSRGIKMIFDQLREVMTSLGVAEIEAAPGTAFDPERHDAVMHVEDEAFGEGVVAEEFQKGFILGEKVIRFSVVKVAN